MSGYHISGGQKYVVNGWNIGQPVFSQLHSWSRWSKDPLNMDGLVAQALAGLNPNAPILNVPVEALEIVADLPSVIKSSMGRYLKKAGTDERSVIHKSAESYLAGNFGLAPLLGALLQLFNFQDDLSKRQQFLLETNRGNKRIKRNLTSESWTRTYFTTDTWSDIAEPHLLYTSCLLTGQMTRNYWFTARMSTDIPVGEILDNRDLSKRMLGLRDFTIVDLWDVIPWTWLIDYFSNIGNFMKAYRPGWEYDVTNINVMYKSTAQIQVTFPLLRPNKTVSPAAPTVKLHEKVRLQPSSVIIPTIYLPNLGARQWGNLVSLAALRL